MKLSAYQFAESLYTCVQSHPSERAAIVKRFLDFLNRKRQKRLLPLIIRALSEVEQEKTGITKVLVETPHPLSQKMIAQTLRFLRKHYNLNKIDHTVIINRALLGGVKLSFSDIIIDASAQSRLKYLNHRIIEGSIE